MVVNLELRKVISVQISCAKIFTTKNLKTLRLTWQIFCACG